MTRLPQNSATNDAPNDTLYSFHCQQIFSLLISTNPIIPPLLTAFGGLSPRSVAKPREVIVSRSGSERIIPLSSGSITQ